MINKYLENIIKDIDPEDKLAIDFGCGNGNDMKRLKKLGWNVIGYDLPETDLNEPLITPQKGDLVYANYVLPFIKKKKTFINNIYNNLKKNGKILICTFDETDEVLRGIKEEELEKLFSKFNNIKIEKESVFDDDEGHHHWHRLLILTGER